MAESYSVKAILSAEDKSFTSTLKNASNAVGSLGKQIKGGFAFGILTGAGMAAFNTLSNGARGLVTEINDSNKAWKTFTGNMQIMGKSSGEISKVRSELKAFAQQTVYSSSDMAQTYAQLESVGTKSTLGLVKGFGGLAAAAENPQQAMKTLSQQATQMAARPTVAWQDFKLMLEQTPAGMAAVAKEMGMTSSELVSKIQAGEVATEDFFAAIEKVGTSASFTKLATEYKTVDQAMDGLKETLGNKLGPAFEVVSASAIAGIEGIIGKIDKIDGEALATKVSAGLEKAQPYWEMFKGVLSMVGSALKSVGGFLLEHADIISKAIPVVLALVAAYKAFKIINAVVPGAAKFASTLTSMASGGISSLGSKLFKVSAGQKAVGNASKATSTQMLASAKAFMMLGAGVFMIAAGFGILAYSAIALANAGGLAIGVMVGMVAAVMGLGFGMAMLLKFLAPMSAQLMPAATAMLVLGAAVLVVAVGFGIMAYAAISVANAGGAAIAVFFGMVVAVGALMAVAALLGPALTAGAVGFIAFGAAILLAGVGALLAAAALYIVAGVLPTIVQYGMQGAASIAVLGASMIVFATGAMLAGAACIVLGAGLTVAAVGIAAAGVAATVLAAAVMLLATGVLLAATGFLLMATSLTMIASSGTSAAAALTAVGLVLTLFMAQAAAAGAACTVLSAGFIVAAAGLTLLGTAAVLAFAGITMLSASMILLASGALLLGSALMVTAMAFTMMAAALPVVAAGTMLIAAGFTMILASSAALSAILLAMTATIVAFGAGSAVATAGILAFGAGMLAASAGTFVMSAALSGVSSKMNSISGSAKSAQISLVSMQASAITVGARLNALGVIAQAAMSKIISSFNNAATKAQSSGQRLGTGFTQGMRGGLAAAPSVALAAVMLVASAFRSGYGSAYSAGAYISQGFAAGMRSCLGQIRAAAAAMAAAADAAVRAKAKIHSPSKVADKLGQYWGGGYAGGLLSMVSDAKNAAKRLVTVPNIAMPDLAMAYGGEMSSDYSYYRNAEYVIEVPLTVDGKEFARATASYTQEELDRRQIRNNRKRGKI